MKQKLLIIAVNNIGYGLSGGDNIAVNLAKHWQSKLDIFGLLCQESDILFKRYKVPFKNTKLIDNHSSKEVLDLVGLIFHQINRLIKSLSFVIKNKKYIKNFQYMYTVSDFYPDLITGFFIKLTHPKIKWISGYYLLAPSPFSKLSPYNLNKRYIRGFIYYLSQILTVSIVKNFANYVFVTSAPDIKKFVNFRLTIKNIIVIQGGVNQVNYQKFFKSKFYINPAKRFYDAVYLGRFHTQKGVLELIDIWSMVVKKIPKAKLVMIGNGDLESEVKNKIKNLNLSDNIKLTGFLEGAPKIEYFKNSKIVVHPAIYDSGGMAAAEAMAWGLPGVSYDLEALKTYYPKGMVKVPLYNQKIFAREIIKLITNKEFYQHISSDAVSLIQNTWNWSKRFEGIYQNIFSNETS